MALILESSIPVGTTGELLRTFEQTTSAGLVQTEAVALADPIDITQVMKVMSTTPVGTEAGAVVRVASMPPVTLPGDLNLSSVDVFNNLIVGTRNNQIEVHFDDTNYLTYTTDTLQNGGTATQANGQVLYATGSNANGRAASLSVDVNTYRAYHELYWAWTAVWPQGGLANSFARIGVGDYTYVNGVYSTFENTTFGLLYINNSVQTFVPQTSWNVDKCNGAAGSGYTLNGAPVAMDTTAKQIFVARAGLLGSLTLEVWVYTPDRAPLLVHVFSHPNQTALPIFSNFDLPMMVDVDKTGAGAGSISIGTACWAGGSTSELSRLVDTITDRTLAKTVRSVSYGKTTAGGGGYVAVKVTPSGAQTVDATGSTVSLTAGTTVTLATQQVIKKTATLNTAGNNNPFPPTAGKSMRILYFGYSAGAGVNGCVVTLALPGYNGGAAFDTQNFVSPGQPFGRNVGAGQDYVQGSVGSGPVVNLSTAQTIYMNIEYIEV